MDVVVTVPKDRWLDWLDEGDNAGDDPTGRTYEFAVSGRPTRLQPGERVYVVAHGRLRGYAPLVGMRYYGRGAWGLLRAGGAVAVTITADIPGFRGWRYRWWQRAEEYDSPTWKTYGVR